MPRLALLWLFSTAALVRCEYTRPFLTTNSLIPSAMSTLGSNKGCAVFELTIASTHSRLAQGSQRAPRGLQAYPHAMASRLVLIL